MQLNTLAQGDLTWTVGVNDVCVRENLGTKSGEIVPTWWPYIIYCLLASDIKCNVEFGSVQF